MFGKDQGLWQQQQPSSLLRGLSQNPGSNLGQGMLGGGGGGSSSAPVGDKPALCKYFVNGGCLRGDTCSFLHELPDERHLDVNGLGFIFNSNVHNAGKSAGMGGGGGGGGGGSSVVAQTAAQTAALHRKITPPVKKQIPRYRPPEPHLEHNLPPALATAFNVAPADIMTTLMRTMLDSSSLR